QKLWPDHCVAGSPGAALDPALPDERLTMVLRKGTRAAVDSYSGFRENPDERGRRLSTGLGAWLRARGVERITVVGLALDYCVQATAVDGRDEGFETIVARDLTRPVADPAPTLERLRQSGVRLVECGDTVRNTK